MTNLDKRTRIRYVSLTKIHVYVDTHTHTRRGHYRSIIHARFVSALGISAPPILAMRVHSVIYADEAAGIVRSSKILSISIDDVDFAGMYTALPVSRRAYSGRNVHIHVHMRVYIAHTLHYARGMETCLTYRDYFPRAPFRYAFASKKICR